MPNILEDFMVKTKSLQHMLHMLSMMPTVGLKATDLLKAPIQITFLGLYEGYMAQVHRQHLTVPRLRSALC